MKSRMLMFITALTVLAMLAVSFPLAAQDDKGQACYQVTNLGTLGGTWSTADAISNNGWISGVSALTGDNNFHAFLWTKRSGMTDLGTLGGPNSYVHFRGVNDRGLVAGVSDTSHSDPYNENFCINDSSGMICLGFLWQDGVMTPLRTLGGNNGWAGAVNNRGQVAGIAENSTKDPNCTPPQVFDWAGVIWGPRPGEMHELLPLSGDAVGGPAAINDRGQAAGVSGPCTSPSPSAHAVLWQKDGNPVDLGSLGGATGNMAFNINNRGQVVGVSDLAGDTTAHAFLWTEEKGMQDLGTLSGDVLSFALAINNLGQVVGQSVDASGNGRAFLWTEENGMQDLNTQVCKGTSLYLINNFFGGINDRGEIVGQAYDPNTGDAPAYLAVPTHGRVPWEAGPFAGQKVLLPENIRQQSQKRHFGPFAVGVK